MNKKKIIEDYLKKIRKIDEFNKFYYDESKPLISDNKYDLLKNEILYLEKKYNFLSNDKSPSKSVGFRPSKNFLKIAHRVPMLSLANAFSKNDLENFQKKILNFLGIRDGHEIEFSAEPKIDGISASLIYKNGKLIQGLSRGDGREG